MESGPQSQNKQGQANRSLSGAYRILNLHRQQIETLNHRVKALIHTLEETGLTNLEQQLNEKLRNAKMAAKKQKNEKKKKASPEPDSTPSETPGKLPPHEEPKARKFEY